MGVSCEDVVCWRELSVMCVRCSASENSPNRNERLTIPKVGI